MIKGDRPALEKLLADDLTYTHSSALFESKEQFIKSVTSGNIDYVSIVPSESDWKVRVNGNTAIVNGVAAVNVIDTGKDLKIKIRYTTIHTNRGGSWQLQAWQATAIPVSSPDSEILDLIQIQSSDSRHIVNSAVVGVARAAVCGALTLFCLAALAAQGNTPAPVPVPRAGSARCSRRWAHRCPPPPSGRAGSRRPMRPRGRASPQGDEPSIVNLLLFGTSFTREPRLTSRQLDGTDIRTAVSSRLDDFERALAKPDANERLQFARRLLQSTERRCGRVCSR